MWSFTHPPAWRTHPFRIRNQPTFCPSRDRQHSPRTFPDRVSLPQASTWRSRALHGPNLALAAVQTRRGPHCSYGRYSAFVLFLTPSSSPFDPRTPACYDAHTSYHYTHTGRRGCMFAHAHRHLPYIQRPHTRCLSHTRTCGCVFPHAHRHLPHTQRPHTRCPSYTRPFTHACHLPCTRGSTHTGGFTHKVFHPHRPAVHSYTGCWEARTPAHS